MQVCKCASVSVYKYIFLPLINATTAKFTPHSASRSLPFIGIFAAKKTARARRTGRDAGDHTTSNQPTEPQHTYAAQHPMASSPTVSAARAAAAARNKETAMVVYFDLEKFEMASPEMRDAAVALEAVLAGGCKCGNRNPQERFVTCGTHLACELCFEDKAANVNRNGKCTVKGCPCTPTWPAISVPAFDKVQKCAEKACEALAFAIQSEHHKDAAEGARRRAEALGEDAATETDPLPDPFEVEPAAAGVNPKKRKTKADYSAEEWEGMQRIKKQKADKRQQDAREAAMAEGREEARALIEALQNQLGDMRESKNKYKRRARALASKLNEVGVQDSEIAEHLRDWEEGEEQA